MKHHATNRLYLTKDRTRVVLRSSGEAAYLFAGIGDEVSAEDVVRYNLGPSHVTGVGSEQAQPVEPTPESSSEEAEAVATPQAPKRPSNRKVKS